MICPDCGANLDEVPVGDVCPNCGGRRRDATAHAGVALAVAAVLEASATVGYNPRRPWQQKWQEIVDAQADLAAAYTQPRGSQETYRLVEHFFKVCRELADWLTQDAGNSRSMAFVNTDSALRLCDGMAQTTKHHTRKPMGKNQDPITARIASISGSSSGDRVLIEWQSWSGQQGTEDGLDLANRCVAAWEKFLKQEGLI
jgi:hypothetical protein